MIVKTSEKFKEYNEVKEGCVFRISTSLDKGVFIKTSYKIDNDEPAMSLDVKSGELLTFDSDILVEIFPQAELILN